MPAADVEVTAAYTNKAQLTPIRGGGREQGVFVIERLLDHLARRIQVDPIKIRQRNILPANAFPYDTNYSARLGGKVVYDGGDYPAYLKQAREMIGYDEIRRTQPSEREAGKYRGVAVTLYVESTGMGKEGARVEVHEDGSILLAVGSPDTGQSHRTVMSQICAAELGVSMDKIKFVSGDSQAMGVGSGTFASRFALMAGNAVALAARQVRQRAVAAAAELLNITPQAIEVHDGLFSAGPRGPNFTFGEIAKQAHKLGIDLTVAQIFGPQDATTWAGGAHGALVEVDVETGMVKVLRYVAVHDSGKVINPTIWEGQLHGGIMLGLGQSILERIVYDENGRQATGNLKTYVLPRAAHVPHFEVKECSTLSSNNPEGIKGVGEAGTIGALPTIIGAIEDALAPLNLQLNQMPVWYEDIARLCEPLRHPKEPALAGVVK